MCDIKSNFKIDVCPFSYCVWLYKAFYSFCGLDFIQYIHLYTYFVDQKCGNIAILSQNGWFGIFAQTKYDVGNKLSLKNF